MIPGAHFIYSCPYDSSNWAEYEKGWKVDQVFPVNSMGIVTARDKLAIRWSADEVWQTVNDFAQLPIEEARQKYKLRRDSTDWKVALAQEDLLHSELTKDLIVPILYRPFDRRWTYYTGKSSGYICRPRPKVMRNMIDGSNLGLVARRQMLPDHPCNYFFVANVVISDGLIRSDNKGGESLLPLYLYPEADRQAKNLLDMIDATKAAKSETGRIPNIALEFIKAFCSNLKLSWVPDGKGDLHNSFGPEDVFNYIYAILHSPTYRERYAEYLKLDFPRIPLTSNKKLMKVLCDHGEQLKALHLMESSIKTFATFPEKGTGKVERITYTDAKQRGVHQPRAIFRQRAPAGLGVPHRRLPGMQQVAQGPQRPRA